MSDDIKEAEQETGNAAKITQRTTTRPANRECETLELNRGKITRSHYIIRKVVRLVVNRYS